LGPWGEGSRVVYGPHGLARATERLFVRFGIDEQVFERLVRFPNTRRRDESPDEHGETRIRHWIRVETTPGRFRTVRIVFVPADDAVIEVVTVVVEESEDLRR
jgi:hypothetical protein